MNAIPFSCPFCEVELDLPEDAWYHTCHKCGKRINLSSQFAYLRGIDAFAEGQDLLDSVSPRKRRGYYTSQVTDALKLFMEAYSSLQLAFQAELGEFQRALAVEMMASMSQEFMKREMVSPLEMNYWTVLMMEQTAQSEYDQIKDKLAGVNGNDPLTWIKRFRWRSRQKQLVKALADMDNKVKLLENQIEFTEVPRARNKRWMP